MGLLQALFSKPKASHAVPKHVAIIMDGNRRWAKKRGVPTAIGHWKGAESLDRVVEAASDMGIGVLTVYSFSTENWNRPRKEVSYLMDLFIRYLSEKKGKMIKNGVRLDTIGDTGSLPEELQQKLDEVKEATSIGSKITLVLAINYGSHDELTRSVRTIGKKIADGELEPEAITDQLIATHLDSAAYPDPDLLIRTSGEYRLSNFMLWQISYAEIFISKKMWPDFSPNDLAEAVGVFQKRERRHGG